MPAEVEPVTRSYGVDIDALQQLKEDLVRRDAPRHDRYDEIMETMGGHWETRRNTGVFERTIQKLLPWYSDSDKDRPVVYVNLLDSIVEFKRSMFALLPSLRVPTRTYEADEVKHAQQNEHLVWKVERDNLFGKRFSESGWAKPVFGNSVIETDFDMVNERPKITVREPYGFYPLETDTDGIEFSKVVFVDNITGWQADARWPGKGFDAYRNRTVEVCTCWSPDYKVIFSKEAKTKSGLIEGKTNPLKFVPVVCDQNKGKPRSMWGDSDAWNGLELHREFQRRMALEIEWVLQTVYAPWVIRNPIKMPKRIPYGPGAVLGVSDGGGLERATPGASSYKWDAGKAELRSLLQFVTDTQDQLSGQMDSAIVTGKGFSESMVQPNQRMMVRHQHADPAWEAHFSQVLRMVEKVWWDKKFYLYGTKDSKRFAYSIYGEEVDGFYDVEVYRDATHYLDVSQRLILGMQMVNQGLLSEEGFMEMAGVVQDRVREMDRIRRQEMDKFRRTLAMQFEAQQMSAMIAPSDQIAQGVQAMGRGSIEPLAPPPTPAAAGSLQLPSGPPVAPEPGAAIEGEAVGEDLGKVADAIRETAKIRGQVWLVGGILDGTVDEMDRIEVQYTDPLDKGTINVSMNNKLPEFRGKFRYEQVEGAPAEPALEVTPGTEELGYEANNDEVDLEGLQEVPLGEEEELPV